MNQPTAIHHLALTVSDLDDAMRFFTPLLEFLGYTSVGRYHDRTGRDLYMHVHPDGTYFNVWQADKALKNHRFEVYAPGLHHVAFRVANRETVDDCHSLLRELAATVLDEPGEFYEPPYYAVYFLGPDNLKFEVAAFDA